MREQKFSDDTKKSKTSTDASTEVVFLNGGDVRRSRTWQRKAAGQQRHLLERLGFGEGMGRGRARTGRAGETGREETLKLTLHLAGLREERRDY